jgi:hypothetical protein
VYRLFSSKRGILDVSIVGDDEADAVFRPR